MNKEQIASAVRWFGATFGGAIAGYFVARGWLTTDQVMSVLSSEVFISLATSVVFGVWGIAVKTRRGLIKSAAQLPEVQRIEVTDRQIAKDVNPLVDATVTTAPPLNGR